MPGFSARGSRLTDWPIDEVAAAVAASGERVCVVIPARDEAATIGEIVSAVSALRDIGLVHDVVVVDSNSRDATADLASKAGARIVRLTDVVPGIGVLAPRQGKGEAMWRGLAATTADLVVFIDGDLIGFDPAVIASLVGPLIRDRSLAMIKGAYDRPGSDPNRPTAGGGRVTELMARPLIGAFWPALSGVLQPLGGEYSARRKLLEAVPFRCGYGVEIGLLVDTLRIAGADSIGQVDLGERMHRNSDLASLGRMSAAVLHTALDRLETEGRLDGVDRVAALSQPQRIGDGFVHDLALVDTDERPPLAALRAQVAQDRGNQVATM